MFVIDLQTEGQLYIMRDRDNSISFGLRGNEKLAKELDKRHEVIKMKQLKLEVILEKTQVKKWWVKS